MSILVNRLLEQDHGHDHGLYYKAQTHGDDVEHVFENHSSKEQQHQTCPHEHDYVQIGDCVTKSSQQG